MINKKFVMVLHCHLPYVLNHGTWPHGTDWLYEASAETYIPLLQMLDRLYKDKIRTKITINITPILLEQFDDSEFKEGFIEYLNSKISFAINDQVYFQSIGETNKYELAFFWEQYYKNILEYFDLIGNDLIKKFNEVSQRGQVEIITCGATHGYFPLLGNDEAIKGQVGTAVETYKKYFHRMPKGIWLPENAYRPAYKWKSPIGSKYIDRKGIEEILSEYGIEYFFVDTHLIKSGQIKGIYIDKFKALQLIWENFKKQFSEEDEKKFENLSPYKPYRIYHKESKNVYVLVRDEKTGTQVWSGDIGYPGDSNYLEFHKKKFPGGLKYWKVTGNKVDLGNKFIYNPEKALEMAQIHAQHFVTLLHQISQNEMKKNENIIVSLYDAELFGHWWFEGIMWLENLYRILYKDKMIQVETAYNVVKENKENIDIVLPEGSWGQGGFHYIWLNEWTKWTWKYIYEAENAMVKLINSYRKKDKLTERILKQMARELLLLESSDWQFLISTWSARDYAENRITYHYGNFKKLYEILTQYKKKKEIKKEDLIFLSKAESIDNVFENINLENWSRI